MATSAQPRYRINGVIDTARPVMRNLENIANSCVSWLTYDITDGKWAVVINKADSSSFSFDDSNILGGIDVNGTGLDDLYNAVEVQFANRDLDDSNDYIRLDLLPDERKTNEPDNLLNLTYPLINDPITAEAVGLLELNQSRVETTISFMTDYTASSVSAGDVISVTNTAHGYTNKLYRVLQTEELNSAGAIQIKISALEYDATVYDGDFSRVTRSNADGIITAGALPKMPTPTVTKLNDNNIPRILIESTIPATHASYTGLITGVEVWVYPIPDTELSTSGTGDEWEAVDDAARNYNLHTILRPNPNDAYTPEQELDYYVTDLTVNTGFAGNFLVKLRAINDVAKGPYSDHSGLVNYVPKQVTDVVDNDTEVDDGAGNILTTLGLGGLLALLNGFLADGDTGIGSLWKKIFDTFTTEAGFDLDNENLKDLAGASSGPVVTATAGTVKDIDTPPGTGEEIYTTPDFSPPFDANYQLVCVVDQNGSGALGGRGAYWGEDSDLVACAAILYNVTDDAYPINTGSGGVGAFGWTDFSLVSNADLDITKTYRLIFLGTAVTESNPTMGANWDVGWSLNSVGPTTP